MDDQKAKMKRRLAKVREGAAAPDGTAAAPETPPAKPKPEGTAFAVFYTCGHKVGLRNLQQGPCPACARKNQAARGQRRQQRKGAQPGRRDDQRLPDGSSFAVAYDAVAVRWRGTLTVPLVATFQAEAGAVFKLLGTLDQQYRDHLAQRGETSAGQAR